MAKRVQRRRGSTTEHSTFIGAEGEVTVDTDKDVVIVHDGTTAGGHPSAKQDLSNVNLSNIIGVTELNVADGTSGQVLSTNGTGTLSFTTVDATSAIVGGDLSGTVGNAQLVSGSVETTELATNAVTTIKITDANITTSKLATGSVTADKLATDSVTTIKITDANVTTSKLATGSVTADKLATDSVTTAKILDSNVSASKLSNDSVTTAKIVTSAITTTKLATNSVTDVKIATGITSSKLTGDLPAISGEALSNLPYDVAFTAGFDKDMLKENVAVATYGELVMARTGTFVGEAGYIDTAATGATVIVDILKNGTTIYSTKPLFAISGTALTAGVLSVTSFTSSDRITFKITQIGSSALGQGVRFTLKCKV
jgi:hypothetical protein